MRFANKLAWVVSFCLLTTPAMSSSTTETTKTKQQLEEIAREISVRFLGNGTGIIVASQKQESEYSYVVLTNAHVAANQEEYKIETADGNIHQADAFPTTNQIFTTEKLDLFLLRFSSIKEYLPATIGNSAKVQNESRIYIAGFPCQDLLCEETGFSFKPSVALLLDQSLVNGYQVGYTIGSISGMSGGPVLNERGEVIAIHGEGRYPLGNNEKYNYLDGNKPSKLEIKYLRHFDWGIPINTYEEYLPPNFLQDYSQGQIKTSPSPVSLTKIENTSNKIENTSKSNDLNSFYWLLLIIAIELNLLLVILLRIFSFCQSLKKPQKNKA